MSEVKTGSEIERGLELAEKIIMNAEKYETEDELEFMTISIEVVKQALDKKVIVPEEKWQRLEKMLFFKNVLEGDVLIPQTTWREMEKMAEQALKEALEQEARLERIKTLIENCPNKHLLVTEYWNESQRWFEELRKVIKDD